MPSTSNPQRPDMKWHQNPIAPGLQYDKVGEKRDREGDALYTCPHCPEKEFATSRGAAMHITKMHPEVGDAASD